MDSAQNVISFCTGYSGLEIGIRRAGVDVRTICYLEIEVYVQAVLVKAMEEGRLCSAPIWSNVKSFDARPFRGIVDGITGGFPCQPFSSAGKRKGQEDPRHLWPSIANAIRLCRPGWVFLENVPGLVTLGLRDVLQDLGQMGYRTTWNIFSAEEVGAPHQRKRVFILARLGNPTGERPRGGRENREGEQSEVFGAGLESDAELAHSASAGKHGELRDFKQEKSRSNEYDCNGETIWPARPGEEQYEWEEPRVTEAQSELGGATHGTQHRVDRLRLLGNGVVPQTAELAWRTLWKKMN